MSRIRFIVISVFLVLQMIAGDSITADQVQDRRSRPVGSIVSSGSGVNGKRIALVLGNTSYIDKPLPNAQNDAQGMATALRSLGFEVIAKTNQKQSEMKIAIREFGEKLASGEGNVGIFYFAGHGFQHDGRNYMVPIDASATDEIEAVDGSVNLELVLGKMEKSGKGLKIVILDACRDSPFRNWRSQTSRGLAFVNAPSGTIIAYSTAPGQTAADGKGDNSPYTGALLRHITKPNNILRMFELVGEDVQKDTNEKQIPWMSTSSTNASEFYLVDARTVPIGAIDPDADPVPRRSIYTSMSFQTGIINNGILQQSNGVAEVFTEDLGKGVTLEMVKIPGGQFLMGEDEAGAAEYVKECERWIVEKDKAKCREWAGWMVPQHRVRVKGFLMGKYEVTQRQWRAVMGVGPPEMEKLEAKFKSDDKPVVNVSWAEVMEFIGKLNQKLGLTEKSRYRLPSEAEWEYAARAGTRTAYAFGETITPDIVNYDGNYPAGTTKKGRYREIPILVGALPLANGFGLYDMHGNVWEWCDDEFHQDYSGAPIDGSAWNSSEVAANRVVRGGSWYSSAVICRSAYRYGLAPGVRSDDVGFRLSRTLP